MNANNANFIKASRRQLRFKTSKGNLSTEDLWALSLDALNKIAIDVNNRITSKGEVSFLPSSNTREDKELDMLKTSLEIVKYIINTKVTEKNAATKRNETLQQKALLQQLVEKKQMQEFENMSKEELEAKIASLSS